MAQVVQDMGFMAHVFVRFKSLENAEEAVPKFYREPVRAGIPPWDCILYPTIIVVWVTTRTVISTDL